MIPIPLTRLFSFELSTLSPRSLGVWNWSIMAYQNSLWWYLSQQAFLSLIWCLDASLSKPHKCVLVFVAVADFTSPFCPLSPFMSPLVVFQSSLVTYTSCPGTTMKLVASEMLKTAEHVSLPSLILHPGPTAHLSPTVSSAALCRSQEEGRVLLDLYSRDLTPMKPALSPIFPPSLVGSDLKSVLLKKFLFQAVIYYIPGYFTAFSEADAHALMALRQVCLAMIVIRAVKMLWKLPFL